MARISAIPKLATCPGFALLQGEAGGSSAAADTGSAAGRIIEMWHRFGEHASALEEAMQTAVTEQAEKFPQADMEGAQAVARGYAQDPRNRGVVVPSSLEAEVRLSLPPAPEDPTGEPVVLLGHVDQIRNHNGTLRVWDTKNGKGGGLELLYTNALQIAAYALAATETFGKPVLPGGIIRLQAYKGGPRSAAPAEANAHFEAPWSLESCRTLIATAVQHIAWLRLGLVHLQPGIHCQWCPAGGPHLCGDKIDRLPVIGKGYVR